MNTRSLFAFSLLFAALGLLMSGYLSYQTLFAEGCHQGVLAKYLNCGSSPVKIFGQPNCVYGFLMYLLTAVVAAVGFIRRLGRTLFTVITVIGAVGTAFAASLSVYELWIADIAGSTIPACVYGFFLYVLILASGIWGLRLKGTPPVTPPAA